MSTLFFHNVIDLMLTLLILLGACFGAYRVERATARYVSKRLGWRGVLFTAWVGVPVHELSHLFFARLFRHRIISWKLF
ncbi:MAG: hypothetical protein R3C68_13050 [Myxococcota bacterium]